MSSTYTWSGSSGTVSSSAAANAVNGVNNQQIVVANENGGPGYYPRVCSVTAYAGFGLGWWMVDLGATYHITSVKIWGVPDNTGDWQKA